MTMAKNATCPECGGSGDTAPSGDPTPDAFEYCSRCNGSGRVPAGSDG